MSRVTCLRGSILGSVPVLFCIAASLLLLCSTPHSAYAVRAELDGPGDGSGYSGIPGQGDDDQPTINPPSTRRTTVQVAPPDSQSSGPGTPTQSTSFSTVRRYLVSGRDFLRRVFTLVR